MRLNDTYLAVQWETFPEFRQAFLQSYLSDKMMKTISHNVMAGNIKGSFEDAWKLRVDISDNQVKPPDRRFLLTANAQKLAAHVNVDKINLRWFRQVVNQSTTYVLNADEFFRFYKTDDRINILHVRSKGGLGYDSYSILLDAGKLMMADYQNKESGKTFIRLLLFVELGEVTTYILKANGGKVKFGKEKVKNDTGLVATIIDSTWNRMTIVQGGFTVRQHLRVQPCGRGRKEYRMVWVREYQKGTYIKKNKHETKLQRGV